MQRDIYVRPPTGWADPYIVWKLKKYAYGSCEPGRIWQLIIDGWTKTQHIEEIPGLPQLFIRREQGRIVLVLCKVVDDILLIGSPQKTQEFNSALTEKFKVGRMIMEQTVVFNGIRISRESNGDVLYDMEEYFNYIHAIDIPRDRRKQPNSPYTEMEKRNFLSLTGSLNWLGHGVLPQASFAASHLQQMMGNLTVSCLVTANKILSEVKTLQQKARMVHPPLVEDPSYLAFSNALRQARVSQVMGRQATSQASTCLRGEYITF